MQALWKKNLHMHVYVHELPQWFSWAECGRTCRAAPSGRWAAGTRRRPPEPLLCSQTGQTNRGGETRQERINDAQEISFFFYVDQLCEERSDVKPAFSSRRKKTNPKQQLKYHFSTCNNIIAIGLRFWKIGACTKHREVRKMYRSIFNLTHSIVRYNRGKTFSEYLPDSYYFWFKSKWK